MAPRNLLYQTAYADDPWWQGGLEGTETARAAALPWDAEVPSNGRRTDYFSSPVQTTGGFGRDGRSPFQERTKLTPQGSGMVHEAASQAYEARRPPSPVQGSSYTHDPLVPDPGPRQRRTTPTGGDPGNPSVQVQRPAGAAYSVPSAPGPPGSQPQGFSPTGQPAKRSLWQRGVDYLNEPAFPRDEYGREKPMTRMQMLGTMLGSAGRAIGSAPAGSPLLSTGLTGAHQGRQEARAYENQRADAATNDWYKRIKGQADLAQARRGDVKVVGNKLVRVAPDGSTEVLQEADPTEKQPSNAFQAAWQRVPPDERTPEKALQLQERIEGARDRITPYQQETLALRRQEVNRPRGTGTAPAGTQLAKALQERNALPPGDPRIADYDRLIASIGRASGSTTGTGTAAAPGYSALTPTQLTRAQDSIVDADEVIAKVSNIEAFGPDLDDLMTTRGSAESNVSAYAERKGLTLQQAAQEFLAKKTALTAATEDLSGAIRNERFGATLTPGEVAAATRNMPDEGDSVTQLRTKLRELKKIATQVANRASRNIEKGVDIRQRPEPADAPPPPPPAGQPAEQRAPQNIPQFQTPADVQAAVAARVLRPGDRFEDANGDIRTVPGG